MVVDVLEAISLQTVFIWKLSSSVLCYFDQGV